MVMRLGRKTLQDALCDGEIEEFAPEQLAQCPECGGDGCYRETITVYEHGCGFPHKDVDERPCQHCGGNEEVVTDWDRYLHPYAGDVGDEAVAECSNCEGNGVTVEDVK